jgi:hypothetical protein
LKMKPVRNDIGIIIILVIILSTGAPGVSDTGTSRVVKINYATSADAGEVTGVPYAWQEINGFCHWAAYSMILQYAGAPLDMYSLFAGTGIGFSATYLRYDTNMLFFPGPFYRQMVSTLVIEEMYGLNITMCLDRTSSDIGELLAEQLGVWDVEFSEITGWDEAFKVLKDTIDSGYPLEVWTDPYYLPVWDYDIVRELNIHAEDTSSGHAVVLVGYNETAGIVHILDPGVGAFGEVRYPEDGRYYYDMNLTQLNDAWRPLFYGCFIAKPGEGPPEDFTSKLGNHVLDRMRGDRASYIPDMESAFFWILGSDAFRGLAYDLTSTGLSSYINEFGDLSPMVMAQVLKALGMTIEGFLSIQYLSFGAALESLPDMLPDLELDEFLTEGHKALEHFDALSNNSTMVDLSYEGGATITTETFNNIAYDCAYTQDGDIDAAVAENQQDLDTIRNHLFAIADAWDAAAAVLDRALNNNTTAIVIVAILSISALVGVVSIFVRRRLRA